MENLEIGKSVDPKNKSNFKFQIKKETVYVLLLLALVNWVSHFLYFMRFGLYEDDFFNIGMNLGISYQQLLNIISSRLTHWLQGHPLSFLPVLFTYIGEMLGSFHFLYILAFLIVTLNSFLMYKLLKKVFPESLILAVTGAIAFCLFPPDTTKLYLLHAYISQISITFFFIATLFYLNNKKILAYLTVILVIFTYEAPFMVFFGVPFLKGVWNRKFRNEYLSHFIILSSMIALMFLYRKLTGESRVLEASGDMLGVASKAIAALFIGPVFNIFLFLRAPIVTFSYLISSSPAYWWYYDYIYYFLFGCFIFFLWLFYRLKPDFNSESGSKSISAGVNSLIAEDNIRVNEYFKKIIKLLIAAIILICLAYSVSFTHFPPTALTGRMTSVHVSATIGASIIFGCVCASIFFLSERYGFKKYAVIFISLYLSLLVGYNTYAQKEFVESWSFQKSYWSKVIKLCPDMEENTVILANIPFNKLFVTKTFIRPFSLFSDKYIISYFFKFPQKWKKPFYQHVYGKMEEVIDYNNGVFILHSRSPQKRVFPPMTINDSNVILIKMDENDNLVRIDSSITINGKKLHLKPKEESTIDKFEKTKLYDLMIKP